MKRSRRAALRAGLLAPIALAVNEASRAERGAVSKGGKRPRLALALGSGSHHGHALIGVMRAFEAAGMRPDLIVGTSVGAIVGALWASGLDSEAIGRAAGRITLWRNAKFTWPTRGLFSNRGLQETVRELAGGRPIESWPIRFAAVASDQRTGERVVIDRGDAGIAVAASASMPVLCQPVAVNGRLLVDGALTEPVPVRTARELGGQRVVGFDIAYRPADAPVESVYDGGFQALHILVNALIAEQRRHADVFIPLALHALMEGRADYGAVLAQAGERATREAWPRIVRG